MKRATLIAAVAVIALSNAFALIHAARNRAGEPEAELTLTNRELDYSANEDDSGVLLNMTWTDPDARSYSTLLDRDEEPPPIIGKDKLAALGFDVSVPPEDKRADSFYVRQTPRAGFAALELDGPAWQTWAEARRRYEREQGLLAKNVVPPNNVENEIRGSTRLVLVDAGRDASELRARHPDKHAIVIVPAVIGIQSRDAITSSSTRAARPARLRGLVLQLPIQIHVPKPFSDVIRDIGPSYGDGARSETRYRVHVRWGSLLEPWIADVESASTPAPR